jgi:hypothetical protein
MYLLLFIDKIAPSSKRPLLNLAAVGAEINGYSGDDLSKRSMAAAFSGFKHGGRRVTLPSPIGAHRQFLWA